MTLWMIVQRLRLLEQPRFQQGAEGDTAGVLEIHLVGADWKEGRSALGTMAVFSELLLLLASQEGARGVSRDGGVEGPRGWRNRETQGRRDAACVGSCS